MTFPRHFEDARGGGAARVNLDEIPDQAPKRDSEIVALDAALEQLAKVDPRKVQVIEMRYFSGLSVEETAAAIARKCWYIPSGLGLL